MEKSTVAFQIDRAWMYSYNKVVSIVTEITGSDNVEEQISSQEFPIPYLIRCDKKFENEIIEALKKINTISNVYVCPERKIC